MMNSVVQQIAGEKLLIPLNYWHWGVCLHSSSTVSEWVWEFSIFCPFQWHGAGIELTGDEGNDIDIIRPTCGWLCQIRTWPWWQRSFHMDTSLGRITCLFLSGWAPRHFAEQPKNMLFPAAISFYSGTFAQTGMLAFQTWVPLFLSLRGTLHSGPCAVSQQCSGVGAFSSLNHAPIGHLQHMEFIPLHALFTSIQHQ